MPNRQYSSPSIGECARARCHYNQSGEEQGAIKRLLYSDIGDSHSLLVERFVLLLAATKKLDQKRSSNVEAFNHQVVHGCGQIEALTGERLQFASREMGR